MSLRNASPVSFLATTVTDALDGTNAPPGSMAALVNLIPDPTTNNLFIPRPASELLTDFPGFTDPGFISVFFVSGSFVYGMIATATTPGYDQPFCYDTDTQAFITVTGTQNSTTLPLSPSTSGAWTPPIMDLVGVQLIVTHPGFPGGVGVYFGWFDVTTPSAPVWHAGNTTVNPLTAVPKSVAQFNGRAYYAVGNNLVFSDALAATVVTNASQVLTLGDNRDITALAGFPLNSLLTGGIVQALIVFKAATIMYQVTGDPTTSDLAINAFTTQTGTLAPNTLAQTPAGLAFVSPQGLRILSTQMQIGPPIGIAGSGVSLPFIYAEEPSRMCAAYNNDILRISTQNGIALGTPFQEWWYDFDRQIFTGPHSFPASYIKGYTHPAGGDHPSFIMAPQQTVSVTGASVWGTFTWGVDLWSGTGLGKLFDSHTFPALVPTYEENGHVLSFEWTTSILPDTDQMSESYFTESTIKMSLPAGINPVTVSAIDEDGTVLQSVPIASQGVATIWGAFYWGASLWRGTPDGYKPRRVPWTEQVTFRMVQISVTGDSVNDFRIGAMQNRFQITAYLQQ